MTSPAICTSSGDVKWKRQCLILTLQLGSQTLFGASRPTYRKDKRAKTFSTMVKRRRFQSPWMEISVRWLTVVKCGKLAGMACVLSRWNIVDQASQWRSVRASC